MSQKPVESEQTVETVDEAPPAEPAAEPKADIDTVLVDAPLSDLDVVDMAFDMLPGGGDDGPGAGPDDDYAAAAADEQRRDGERMKALERELFRVDDLLAKTADGGLYNELLGRRAQVLTAMRSIRPVIRIDTADLGVLVDRAEAALVSRYDGTVYQRAGWLVRVTFEQQLGRPVIRPIRVKQLRGLMARSARWEKPKPTKDDPDNATQSFPPKDVCEVLHDQGEWARTRALDALLPAPTIRPDGTVIYEPGYDHRTRSLLFDDGTPWKRVQVMPTRDEALDALARLRVPLANFPFRNKDNIAKVGQDESVALALILTGLTRTAYPLAPLFVITGHTPGSGKGLIVRVAHSIAAGRDFGGGSEVDNTELEKRITTAAREGDSWFVLDDVKEPLGGAALDSAITQITWKARVLRSTESVEAPLRLVWVATGNNIVVKNDLVRRGVRCYLSSLVERPEARTDFRIGDEDALIAWVLSHRVDLVHDALTIIRAYIAAGEPPVVSEGMGSFSGWSRFVRQPLVWLGCAYSRMTQDELRDESDETVNHMEQLLYCWYGLFHDQQRTIPSVLHAINSADSKDDSFEVGLREAFAVLCSPKHVDSVSVGKRMNGVKDRPVRGLRLVRGVHTRSGLLWSVVVNPAQRDDVNLRLEKLRSGRPMESGRGDVGF